MNFSSLVPWFINHVFFVSDFRQLSCWIFSSFFTFSLHCCLCIWNFKCLRNRNEFVNKNVVSHRIHSFCNDVILVRFVSSSFQPWSRAFVDIQQHKRILSRVFTNIAVGFSTALHRCLVKHCCWHRNFQFSPSGFHCELEFFDVWFHKEYPSQCVWHCRALVSR